MPPAIREAQAGGEENILVVPRALDQVPMRYRGGTLMSDLPPHYEILRQAWVWGFRGVRFVAHHQEAYIALPFVLDHFHNLHRGQRCFVVGNGPSLGQIDMTRLRDEITLGSNRCFLGYPSWGFPFTYWGVYDKFQIETYHDVYEAQVPTDTPKFYPVEYAPVLNFAQGCPVNCVWPRASARAFSSEPAQTFVGYTVTYMLLQIAAAMGCDPIILVGVDHRYTLDGRGYSRAFRTLRRGITRRLRGGRIYETALATHRTWKKTGRLQPGSPQLWSTQNASSPTHFSAQYTDQGKNQFLPPEPEEAARDFDCAQAWARESGRQILNATPNSALNSFPRVDFGDLFLNDGK